VGVVNVNVMVISMHWLLYKRLINLHSVQRNVVLRLLEAKGVLAVGNLLLCSVNNDMPRDADSILLKGLTAHNDAQ
jgi:hypothetical protein